MLTAAPPNPATGALTDFDKNQGGTVAGNDIEFAMATRPVANNNRQPRPTQMLDR